MDCQVGRGQPRVSQQPGPQSAELIGAGDRAQESDDQPIDIQMTVITRFSTVLAFVRVRAIMSAAGLLPYGTVLPGPGPLRSTGRRPPWMHFALVGVRDLEQRLLAELAAQQIHTHR